MVLNSRGTVVLSIHVKVALIRPSNRDALFAAFVT